SSTICSRGDNNPAFSPPPPPRPAFWKEATTLRAIELLMGEPPACTSRIACKSLEGLRRFNKYPLAPPVPPPVAFQGLGGPKALKKIPARPRRQGLEDLLGVLVDGQHHNLDL